MNKKVTLYYVLFSVLLLFILKVASLLMYISINTTNKYTRYESNTPNKLAHVSLYPEIMNVKLQAT